MHPTATAMVAANVRAEMARKNVTQVQLAQRLGRTQAAVSRRLRGSVALNIDELAVIAGMLDVTVSRLTDGLDATAGVA